MITASFRFAILLTLLAAPPALPADDWPMLGGDPTRNPVSRETGAPLWWQIPGDGKPARNIRWSAPLGRHTSTPAIADGLVWVGTNNHPVDTPYNDRPDASVLKCFREGDGKLLYEYVSPRHPAGLAFDWPYSSMGNSPLADGDRIWFTTNRCEVVCLDVGPLKRGTGEPEVVWKLDMPEQLGVHPKPASMSMGQTCSVAGYQDFIYVITGNGVDDTYMKVPAPEAPSLVCLRKDTGEVVWSDNSPGDRIMESQCASPLVIDVNGKAQVLAPQGDGWLRSFDARTGELIWEFDANPKGAKWDFSLGKANYFMAPPVYHGGRVYLTQGQAPEFIGGYGHLFCLDPAREGDVSAELVTDDGTDPPKTRPNPNSAVVWKYGGEADPGSGKEFVFGRSSGSCAVADGLVFACEVDGYVHCLDAKTGEPHWVHDAASGIHGSPLVADGKFYVIAEYGEVLIFRASARGGLLNTIGLDTFIICGSPVFANGTLYISTDSRLYAVGGGPDGAGRGGHWPQWRGPDRTNISLDQGLAAEWPDGGPPLAWKATGLGEGVASVAVYGGRVFTLGYRDGREYATALDEVTGEQLWAVPIGPITNQGGIMRVMRWLSQRTPTVDEDRVYCVTADGRLLCLDAETGKERWVKDYVKDFGGRSGRWGYCDYPLVSGDRLICTPGGAGAAIVHLDKFSGELKRKVAIPGDPPSTYGAMIRAELAGRTQYVHQLDSGIFGISGGGSVLWHYPGPGRRGGDVHTALVDGNRVFCSNGWARGRTPSVGLVEITAKDRKTFAAEEVYLADHPLDPWVGSSVLLDGRVYTCSRLSIDWDTGELIGQLDSGPRRNRHTLTCADGRLYHRSGDNTVTVAEPAEGGFRKVAEFQIPRADGETEPTWTFPVVTGGLLYLRDEGTLYAYELRPKREKPDRSPDTLFVPTPQDVVEEMLKLAEVKKSDIVYDLGCGDGRIVVTAAKQYGCKAVGYDLDPRCVEWSQKLAAEEGVAEQVTVERKDLFAADLSDADVVTLYLGTGINARLMPQLKQLKPGARVVSHAFPMPGVKPDRVVKVTSEEGGREHTLYLWNAPIDRD